MEYRLFKYENWWGHKKRLFFIADQIGKNMTCLDVGCGTGSYLTIPLNLLMKERNSNSIIYGLDMSEASINKAKKNARLFEINQDYFMSGDLTKIKEKYDCVICSEVMEHINSNFLQDFTNALCGCVKDGGKLVITVPNGNGAFEKGQRMRKTLFGRRIFPIIESVANDINIYVWKKYMYYYPSNLKTKKDSILNNMTVSMTEHIQFYSKKDILHLFESRGMKLVRFTGANRFSGAYISLIPPFQKLTTFNNWLGDKYPEMASDFYFVFKKSGKGKG